MKPGCTKDKEPEPQPMVKPIAVTKQKRWNKSTTSIPHKKQGEERK